MNNTEGSVYFSISVDNLPYMNPSKFHHLRNSLSVNPSDQIIKLENGKRGTNNPLYQLPR